MSGSSSTRGAFVMAGSLGLGLASARALVDSSTRVALCGRRQKVVDNAVVRAGGPERVRGLAGDLSRPEELARMPDAESDWLQGIDILVANCGGPSAGGFFDLDDAAWRTGYELVVESSSQRTGQRARGGSCARWHHNQPRCARPNRDRSRAHLRCAHSATRGNQQGQCACTVDLCDSGRSLRTSRRARRRS